MRAVSRPLELRLLLPLLIMVPLGFAVTHIAQTGTLDPGPLGVAQVGVGRGLLTANAASKHAEPALRLIAPTRVARDLRPAIVQRRAAAFERRVVAIPDAFAGADADPLGYGIQRAGEPFVRQAVDTASTARLDRKTEGPRASYSTSSMSQSSR